MSDSRPDIAGARFQAELVEQPDALLRLLDGASAAIDAGRAIQRRRLVLSGSSATARLQTVTLAADRQSEEGDRSGT